MERRVDSPGAPGTDPADPKEGCSPAARLCTAGLLSKSELNADVPAAVSHLPALGM